RAPAPARAGPGLLPGVPLPDLRSGKGAVHMACTQPWRCLCLGSVQMTMTRPCRRMIRHLLQIFFTLGLTFIVVSSGAGAFPARVGHFLAEPRRVPPRFVAYRSVTCSGRR